jgi:hypothetical protein
MGLIAVNSDAKTSKGQKLGYFTGIMYLSPHKMANGKVNVCGDATPNCIDACLNTAGRGAMNSVQDARIKKTLEFLENPKEFMVNIYNEIIKLQKKHGQNLVIRLNGTSDLPFENIKVVLEDRYYSNIFEAFPNVQFYDYTKNPRRALTNTIGNYYLTFSRAETKLNIEYSRNVLNEGKNVAMVFSKELHEKLVRIGKIVYNNREVNVIDGDETDLRFLDMPNSIVALKAKGKAIKDNGGFVIRKIEDI